ncbi:DUF2624 domain-containing protein [Litchfieldia alkalitelluris]|uniref:DUF2624 domain-containing protein n=1 Tax=Litchfieldia alkalitelluris TaxID=304268 RepID=UPI001F1B2006|nr:DUF2624 domain-containing protein [Litchfieldia alkalitelluris]
MIENLHITASISIEYNKEGGNAMNIYHKIVNQKIKTLTVDELLSYSSQYDIPLTKPQAQKAIKYLRSKADTKIDIFDAEERKKLLREIAKVTSPDVARQLNSLFNQFAK